MPKSHLHPSMEEPLGKYRQIPTGTIVRSVSSQVIREISPMSMYRRIIEVDDSGDFLTVGILIMLGDKYGVRVLYTWMDLFRVELVRWDDATYEILDSVDDVFLDMLQPIVLGAASMKPLHK